MVVMESEKYVKENIVPGPPLSAWWVVAALAAVAVALGAAALVDLALPAPLSRAAPPHMFIADIAYEHLLNLTSIGPRVAGSYENEVLAVGVVVEAVKRIARAASPHNRVELDVHTASGAFPLTFLDGMNNVYRDVSSVVARVSGVGGRAPHRSALLLNCHIDTVPDSPGASDDGAGCAVLLETMRALAAARRPLRHDAVFLFNGAEENIMQASHGFITQHKWAKSIRAFINIEACGAGGREVLFQAGPHDPWIVEVYAGAVPHPFASSLAQEMFQSGLIPADTDFRIFRDFGRLSGVDLAWSANGYVYHTRLDTADRVPRAALQRTGDNVLALANGMLSSARLESEAEQSSRQPVFFDVLGLFVVTARAPLALTAAAATLALAALDLHVTARQAQRELYMEYGAWLRVVVRAAVATLGAAAVGVAGAVAVALALHASGARLAFFSRGWLLAPLYALPALACAWSALGQLHRPAAPVRGWWAARALHGAGCLLAGGALVACVARGLRSGFLPLAWVGGAAGADLAARWAGGGARAAAWAVGAAPALLQTWYLALGSLRMLVPMMGRAGAQAVPADVLVAVLVATLVLVATGWMLPLVAVTRRVHVLVYVMLGACAVACVAALGSALGAPYAPDTPQRLMVFHTRRTVHAPHAPPRQDTFYWIPDLDDNSPHSVDMYADEFSSARPVSAAECARWLYCGAPYYLPVLSLVSRSHAAPARDPPLPVLRANLTAHRLNDSAHELTLDLQGPAHIVVIVSPGEGARVSWSSAVTTPLEGPRWGRRLVYFFALHRARGAVPWRLRLVVSHGAAAPVPLAQLSVAGHALFGAHKLAPAHARLLAALPPWVAATGWGVDLHLFDV